MIEVLLDIKGVSLIIIRRILIIRMLGQIIFVGEERPHAAQLQDAFPAVHDLKLIHGQKVVTQFLIIQRVGLLPAPTFPCVVGVDSFLAKGPGSGLSA